MKKGIIIVVILGMFAYAIYEFTDQGSKTVKEDEAQQEETDSYSNANSNQDDKNEPDEDVNTNGQSETPDEETGPTVGLERGNIAPDFELETFADGENVKLSDYRGTKVFLNFWATWCGPCRAEVPDMQKLHENKEDVVILAVNLTSSAKNELENIPGFMEEFGVTFEVLLDEANEVGTLYQIKPIPTSFLIDEEGVIQNMAYGALNYEMMIQGFEMMDGLN